MNLSCRIKLLFIILVFAGNSTVNLLKSQSFELVQPADSLVIEESMVHFIWNVDSDDDEYRFETSLDDSFTIVDNSILNSTNELILPISTNSGFHWRVIKLVSGVETDTSESRYIQNIDFDLLDNIFFQFMADSGITQNGNFVESWDEEGQNSFQIGQTNTDRQPLLIESSELLNDHNAVFFDGDNDFLFSNAFDLEQPCNYFLILKEAQLSGSYMDGSNGFVKHLLRYQGGKYGFTSGSGSVASQSNIDTTVYAIINVEVNASVSTIFINGINENTNGTGDRSSEGLTLGGFGTGSSNMRMILPEIIAMDTVINDSLRQSITNYLFDKYAPPLNLGPDINTDNFCDLVLYPGTRFTSYIWSDGSDADSLLIEESGSYHLTVTDIFGRTFSDTINVNLFEINSIAADTICQGESIVWNTNLDNSNYSFMWNDSSTDSLLTISSQDEYWVEVTDYLGCIANSDTVEIVIDNFESEASLGPDVNLCAGNTIELVVGQMDAVSYEWNDMSDEAFLVVNSSNTYWVSVENANGCIAVDSIDVIIIGNAPTASFNAMNFCFGDEVQFNDLSIPPGGESIDSWSWDFGNGESSGDQNPVLEYDSTGTFLVNLLVETAAGCTDDFETTILINPLPAANFIVSNLCADQNVIFNDDSEITEGNITAWSWNFGDSGVASGENVSHVYNDPGSYSVTLNITSAANCSADTMINIDVNPSPLAEFETNSTCLGQAAVFIQNVDTSISGPIDIYSWNFGDGSSSNFPITSHTYFVPGDYDVSLSVTSALGCTDDSTQTISINNLPEAGFSNTIACIGEATMFTDTTTIFSTDSIASWNWNFSNMGASDEMNPNFTFNTIGNINVSMEVVSQAGCEGNAQAVISVFEDPNPDFDFEPGIGLPPLEVSFENLTTDATDFIWDFGNGDGSDQISPEYTYLDSGIFTIQLLAINENGCSETTERTILVIDPIFEIAIIDLFCEIVDNRVVARALISNQGNHDINAFEIELSIGNGARFIENWSGVLRPNDSFIYEFVAQPEYDPILHHPYFCTTVSNPNGNNRELSIDNNSICKALDMDEFFLSPPYPNPNQGNLNFDFVLPIESTLNLEIVDSIGKIVLREEIKGEQGHNSYQTNIPTLESGNYVLRLFNDADEKYQWFFVE